MYLIDKILLDKTIGIKESGRIIGIVITTIDTNAVENAYWIIRPMSVKQNEIYRWPGR
jgi:hypothetical protein